ncbi:hypothetical protein Tco_0689797 [Tanacetum coccineum]
MCRFLRNRDQVYDSRTRNAETALQPTTLSDYVPGPEEPEQAPPSPDYVPGPEHDDDEIVAEDQPYAEDASPIAQSPDYIPEQMDGDDEMDIEEMRMTIMDIDRSDEERRLSRLRPDEYSLATPPTHLHIGMTAPVIERADPRLTYTRMGLVLLWVLGHEVGMRVPPTAAARPAGGLGQISALLHFGHADRRIDQRDMSDI